MKTTSTTEAQRHSEDFFENKPSLDSGRSFAQKSARGFRVKFLLLTVALCLCGEEVFAKPPQVPATPPLRIEVPAFDVKTLSCGMKVIFLKDDRFPLAEGTLSIHGGDVTDPPGKEGLVSLVSEALRNGGAGKLGPEAFDAALEDKAASLSASSDQESFSLNFQCLSGDLPEVLGYFADMARRPLFDAQRLETDKADLEDSLRRLEDTPDALTRVLFYKGLYNGTAYGDEASPKSVAALTRDDVENFYKDHYGPEGSVLSITGNVDEEKVTAQLESLFAGWKCSAPKTDLGEAKPLGPAIYFFPKQVGQVLVRYGVLGLKRHDPKDIPLQVANYILGGSGFTSRLMREIRSNRGLAYFVDSYFIPFNIPGFFEVVGGTRTDSLKEYLTLMFQQLSTFAEKGPTEAELSEAKESMVEEYAYNFESAFKLAPYKASLDFNGYPDDYLATYRDKVKAVTRDQAAEAAKAILSQQNWVLVVSGPAEMEPILASFGTVHQVSSIFEPLGK